MDTPVLLVVDDDEDIRATTCEVLEAEGYTVESASDGAQALKRLQSPPAPALILLDLMMPHMNGEALLREIETNAELAGIQIVVMTAAAATATTSALRYPMLRKPFSLDALLDVVTTYVPRLWDSSEPPTGEQPLPSGPPSGTADTQREPCIVCRGAAMTRCPGCGQAFCRECLDAGPDGRCASCWRAKPGPR